MFVWDAILEIKAVGSEIVTLTVEVHPPPSWTVILQLLMLFIKYYYIKKAITIVIAFLI